MTFRVCPEHDEILGAAAEGRDLAAALRAHLASCPSCRDQAEAAAFVRGLAGATEIPHQLPDPAVVWWKAQLARRWQAERAAAAPIERMRWIELTAGVASLAAFLVWQWEGLLNLLSQAIPASVAAATAAPQTANPTALLLLAGTTVSVGALLLAALHRRLGGASM